MNNPFNQQIEAVFIGDSGSGGAEGLVPGPAAGDAAAGKFLSAAGDWEVPEGGGGSGTPVPSETPSGAVNGSNTIFTLAHTPISGTQIISVNGVLQAVTSDYALSGVTITFVTAPQAGDVIKAYYQY